MTVTIDHLCHGWEMNENGIVMAVCTRDSIAPEGLVLKVGEPAKRERRIVQICVVAATLCQNTDAPPPPSALNDIDGKS